MTIPNRNINFPTAIKFGAGRIKELADHCKANGITRPLFVTDPGPRADADGEGDRGRRSRQAGLGVAVFSDVRPNPVEANVHRRRQGLSRPASMTASSPLAAARASISASSSPSCTARRISVFDLEDVGDWWTRADASEDRADHRGADHGGHGLGSGPRRRRHPSRRRMRRRSSSIRRSCRKWRSSIPS